MDDRGRSLGDMGMGLSSGARRPAMAVSHPQQSYGTTRSDAPYGGPLSTHRTAMLMLESLLSSVGGDRSKRPLARSGRADETIMEEECVMGMSNLRYLCRESVTKA